MDNGTDAVSGCADGVCFGASLRIYSGVLALHAKETCRSLEIHMYRGSWPHSKYKMAR